MCKCTPRTQSAPPARVGVNFRTVFAGGVRFGGIFRRSLSATSKKGRQLFGQEKVHPQTKSWLRPCPVQWHIRLNPNLHYKNNSANNSANKRTSEMTHVNLAVTVELGATLADVVYMTW